MAAASLHLDRVPGATRWTVPIDMPVYETGKDRGRPVGWLTSNNRTVSREGGLFQARRRALWRRKAFATYMVAGLHRRTAPGGVHLQFQWQFVDGTHPDVINLPDTTKPIIDALQPDGSYTRKGKRVELPGIGMIPNDRDWVVIGEQLPDLPFLGPNSRIGGRVVVFITPLPAALEPTE